MVEKFLIRSMVRRVTPLLVALALVACVSSVASACPTCKEAISESDRRLVDGYFWSICFMMSMPFLLFGSFGTYLCAQVMKAKGQRVNPISIALFLLGLMGFKTMPQQQVGLS